MHLCPAGLRALRLFCNADDDPCRPLRDLGSTGDRQGAAAKRQILPDNFVSLNARAARPLNTRELAMAPTQLRTSSSRKTAS
jgi:hypothetical protein